MQDYRISWKRVEYGESFVRAKSEKEARILAEKREDRNFENFAETYGDMSCNWEIDDIEEREEEE